MKPIEMTETIAVPAVAAAAPASGAHSVLIPMLNFPRLYIIAPVALPGKLAHHERKRQRKRGITPQINEDGETLGLAVYSLEAVEAQPFDAWLSTIIDQAQLADPIFTAYLAGFDRAPWGIMDKWRVINELAERGVKLALYDSPEAAQAAMCQMPGYQGEAKEATQESKEADDDDA